MKSATGQDVPQYGTGAPLVGLKPGLYLGLFHGRSRPDEELDDWGAGGPIIGPLEHVHTTYAHHVKLSFADVSDRRLYFDDTMDPNHEGFAELFVDEDMLVYGGAWYGDWTVFTIR